MLNPFARRFAEPDPSRDRRTLLLLVLATVVLGGIFLYAVQLAGRKPTAEESTYTEANDWGGDLVETFGYEPVTLPDDLARQIREDPTGRLHKEKGPYDYLLGEVRDRPFRFFNQRGYTVIPKELSITDLLADPAAHRAEPITVKGTLLHLERKPLVLPAALEEVWEGTLRVDTDVQEGGTPSFVFFEAVEEPKGLVEGQVAQVYGVFYKAFEFPVEDEQGSRFVVGPFFIARKVVRSYYYLDVKEIDPAVLRRVRDETPLQMEAVDDAAWYHLASYARNQDPDEFRKLHSEDVDMTEVYRFPGAFRGKPVKFRGKLIEIWKVPLEDNPTGLDAYYDSIVHTLDGVTTRIRFVRKPTGVARGDYVSIRGLFLQDFKYEARSDGAWPQVPLVVGISIDRIEFTDKTLSQISLILAGTASVLILVFVVSLALGRRRDRQFEKEYWSRRKKRFERVAGAGPSPSDRSDE